MSTRTLMLWLVLAIAVLGAAGLFALNKVADWDYRRVCVEQGRDSARCHRGR